MPLQTSGQKEAAPVFLPPSTPTPVPQATPPQPIEPQGNLPVRSPMFVHSALDDAGLSPAEFRVYGHLSRRTGLGGAFPSIKSMASFCRLKDRTIRQAIRALLKYGMVRRQDRPGRTPLYTLTPLTSWRLPAPVKAHPSPLGPGVSKDTPAVRGQDTPPVRGQGYPSPLGPGEGNPIEGDPQKGAVPLSRPGQPTAPRVWPNEIDKALKEVRLQKQNLLLGGYEIEQLSDKERKEWRNLSALEKTLSGQLMTAAAPAPSSPRH